MLGLNACEPPPPVTPRPTAQAILEVTPAPTFDIDATATVSYTHLRAHETPEHLVCRLLLEKKKKQNK